MQLFLMQIYFRFRIKAVLFVRQKSIHNTFKDVLYSVSF